MLPLIVFLTSLLYMILTLPSLLYHGTIHKYSKNLAKTGSTYFMTTPAGGDALKNKNVVVFVHGRNGWWTDVEGLVENMYDIVDVGLNGTVVLTTGQTFYLRSAQLGATGYTSLEEDAETLRYNLQNYINCNIVLVGISKGGVVAARYVTKYDDPRVSKVVTISSPLMGSKVVDLFFETSSPVYKALGYRNDEVLKIEREASESNVAFYHVVPSCDHLIIPASSAHYSFTPENRLYRYNGIKYSHAGIGDHPEVARRLLEWLGE